MEQTSKTSINTRKIAEIFFYLFVFSLFFPIRYTFLTSTTFKTGIFSDFTSISLYLSDILLILAALFAYIPHFIAKSKNLSEQFGLSKSNLFIIHNSKFIILTIWLILDLFWHFKAISSLNIYFFLKFLELIVAYGTIRVLFQETPIKLRFFSLFAALGTVQAGLAISQFFLQHPLGLSKLGEQQIYAWNQGIAKLVVNSITYIRGYGTFPHPNPLSAYLIATIFILIYLFSKAKTNGNKIIYSLMLAASTFGLITTFSRASFLALGVGLAVFYGFFLIKRLPKSYFVPLGTILVSLIIAMFVFNPFLMARATVSDSASLERVFYAKVGWQMIKANPIFGIGIGESMLHMEQFSSIKLWPWQIQPIHNYFELAAADLGIIGALILVWIFWVHVKSLICNLKSKTDPIYYLLFTIFFCFLILMMFDHYFYTLQQTQLLLWILLGIIAAETQNKIPILAKEGIGKV